jgi:hypothetical protein
MGTQRQTSGKASGHGKKRTALATHKTTGKKTPQATATGYHVKLKRHITAPATAAQISRAAGLTAADIALLDKLAAKYSPFEHSKRARGGR